MENTSNGVNPKLELQHNIEMSSRDGLLMGNFQVDLLKKIESLLAERDKTARTSSRKKTNHHPKLPPRPQKIPNLSVKLRPQQHLRQTREVRER